MNSLNRAGESLNIPWSQDSYLQTIALVVVVKCRALWVSHTSFYNNSFTWEFCIIKSRLAGQMIVVVMKALNKVGIRVHSVIVNPTITILDYVGNCRLCISQLHYYSIHAFKLEDFESSFTSFNKPFVHQFSCGHCSRKRKGHKYMRLD